MVAKMKCIQTAIVALVACLTVVKSHEEYEDQSGKSLSDKVQSKYINMIITDARSRRKRQSEIFFPDTNKWNGESNASPNAISNSDSLSGNADFAFPGEISRPTNYPISNQFDQKSPNNWQGSWLNPNFISDGRNTNTVHLSQINKWFNQPDNEWENGSNSIPQPNLISSVSACQWDCRRYVTSEYNPICGSDGVTYLNPARFKCAVNCGKQITGKPDKTCGYGSPIA